MSIQTSPELESQLEKYASQGHIIVRTEHNPYLKISYKGTNGLVSEKWNVKIYKSESVVTTDKKLLEDILHNRLEAPNTELLLLRVDDAGVGFPLLGVMCGVTDGTTVRTLPIDVKYFQTPLYENKEYLKEYTRQGLRLVQEFFQAKPKMHRIEICTGYVNSHLKDALRDLGFDVRVTEIKGLLQDTLEKEFKAYVKETVKVDLAYDPKDYPNKKDIAQRYYVALNWGKQFHPELLKSGWESMK